MSGINLRNGFLDLLKKDLARGMKSRFLGIIAFTIAYPALQSVVQYIPNPMVPGGVIALNMILPVLAGYFYGPLSGAIAGGAGTGIAGFLNGSAFTILAIIPQAVMGGVAGWTGKYRSEFLTGPTILVGHFLNLLFYLLAGVIAIPAEKAGVTILGLATESVIDIVAIVLFILVLKKYLYCDERW